MATTKVTSTSTHEARGNDWPNVGQLMEILSHFPIGAVIQKVELGDSQRDGSWWHIVAVERH